MTALLAPILSLFPSPRREVTWRSALPLIIFDAVFVAVWFGLQWSDVLLFTRPWVLVLLVVTPWVWWMHLAAGAGLSGWRSVASLVSRLALVGLFIMVLGDPRAIRKTDAVGIVYVIDSSDSVSQRQDDALRFVTRTASGKPPGDEAGLVIFGRTAAVELPVKKSFPLGQPNSRGEDTINARVQRDGTNIEKALSLAAATLPEDVQPRVVLITDGVSTEGSLSRAIDELRSRHIPVDVLPISYNYDNEVWLERIELPRVVKSGETYEAAVILGSLKAGEGKLILQENGREISKTDVKFNAGKNRFTLPIYLREAGYYEYTATIEPSGGRDFWPRNNKAISSLFLRGEGSVLIVTDPAGEPRDYEPLEKALRESRINVTLLSSYELPRKTMELMPYDAIILANVPADQLDASQLKAVHDSVKDLGAGLLMVGGKNSFGAGGYHNTLVEDALPVNMDVTQRKVLPKAALAILLHTCEFPEGNAWGREITKMAIKRLGSQDEVALLYYDWTGGGEKFLFKLTPAGQYEKLATLINGAEPGDMPAFQPLMQMALNELKASDAATKHLIMVSDGDPQPPTPQLVQDFVDSKISVSTVAVFPHGGQEQSKLNEIAKQTGGRYYFPQSAKNLPGIFINEARTLKRSLLQNKTFTPTVTAPSDILKGLDSLPRLYGYVLTTLKPRSQLILRGPDGEDVDPILAQWRYGLGKSAVWTSDLAPNWGLEWVQWGKYRAFVKQLVTDISRTEHQTYLRMQTYSDGDKGVIQVEDYAPEQAMLEMQARVDPPTADGTPQTVTLRQVAPRRYEGSFDVTGEGRYQVTAFAVGTNRSERVPGMYVLPYSREYLRFRSDPLAIQSIIDRTGGRLLDPDITGNKLFDVNREARQSSKPVVDWFLIALACLIPIDVGLRRVQPDMSVLRGWFSADKRREVNQKAMGALLERKKKVAAGLGTQKEKTPAPDYLAQEDLIVRPGDIATPPTTTPAAQASPQTPTEEDKGSTTGRLLARKKQQQKPDDPPPQS